MALLQSCQLGRTLSALTAFMAKGALFHMMNSNSNYSRQPFRSVHSMFVSLLAGRHLRPLMLDEVFWLSLVLVLIDRVCVVCASHIAMPSTWLWLSSVLLVPVTHVSCSQMHAASRPVQVWVSLSSWLWPVHVQQHALTFGAELWKWVCCSLLLTTPGSTEIVGSG